MLVNLRDERVIEPSRAETVRRRVKHLLIKNLARDFSGCFSYSVPIYHVRHVALIAWDHCGLSASGYLISVRKGGLLFQSCHCLKCGRSG